MGRMYVLCDCDGCHLRIIFFRPNSKKTEFVLRNMWYLSKPKLQHEFQQSIIIIILICGFWSTTIKQTCEKLHHFIRSSFVSLLSTNSILQGAHFKAQQQPTSIPDKLNIKKQRNQFHFMLFFSFLCFCSIRWFYQLMCSRCVHQTRSTKTHNKTNQKLLTSIDTSLNNNIFAKTFIEYLLEGFSI